MAYCHILVFGNNIDTIASLCQRQTSLMGNSIKCSKSLKIKYL